MPITTEDFWYIAATSAAVNGNRPLKKQLLGQPLVLFRGASGQAVALPDRCLHRMAPLSEGSLKNGELTCPYHGWTYDQTGTVTHIPSLGCGPTKGPARCLKPYRVTEQEGYVYVSLSHEDKGFVPFGIPHYGERGWKHIRLINHFHNNVTNCAENFVDIPHTVFVHPGIFRKAKNQKLSASIRRENGSVLVEYKNETSNLGWFSWFLNRQNGHIEHFDHFHMPNVTSVEYRMGPQRHFFITSQSIPITEDETLVYTDLTYNYGMWNHLVAPVVRWHAQAIIDQDIKILAEQMNNIKRFGGSFQNTPADLIHVFIEDIRRHLSEGQDPRTLPRKDAGIEFWV